MDCSKRSQQYFLSIFLTICAHHAVASEESFSCEYPGKFPHIDPTKYHECHLVGDNKFSHFIQKCPIDNCFVSSSKSCQFSEENCKSEEGDMVSPKPAGFTCPHSGKFSNPDMSVKGSYFKCVEVQGSLFAYQYQCLPTKPCFNPDRGVCHAGEPCY